MLVKVYYYCKAKLSIVIKKITKATKKTDKYLKYDIPLVGEVKISLLHTHNTTSAETLRMLRVNDEVQLLNFMMIIFGQFCL
ncbi:hypothetical protein TNCT_208071 [Trichonephila clavata]|uniref:Uncharacterized protein n=1 Tax=Trichonephila clavata TaxID=2740835 RepID=A0A8X6LJ13_TRICU|nr:hypothetical protein TNCT_208071 [Trichonephila clavata]